MSTRRSNDEEQESVCDGNSVNSEPVSREQSPDTVSAAQDDILAMVFGQTSACPLVADPNPDNNTGSPSTTRAPKEEASPSAAPAEKEESILDSLAAIQDKRKRSGIQAEVSRRRMKPKVRFEESQEEKRKSGSSHLSEASPFSRISGHESSSSSISSLSSAKRASFPKPNLNYKLVFLDAPFAQALCHLNGNFIECNDKFAELTGIPREDAIRYTIFVLMDQNEIRNFLFSAELLISGKLRKFPLKDRASKFGSNLTYVTKMSISVIRSSTTGVPQYFSCVGVPQITG